MRILRSILLLTTATLLAACGNAGTSSTTSTASAPAVGAVETGAAVPRIVSLVPAATLNLVLIGASNRLVGGTRWDRLYLPADRRDLPVVGDYDNTDYEALAALRPTAVIVQKDDARIDPRLRELSAASHMEIINIRFDKIDDIWSTTRTLGRIAGIPDKAEAAIAAAQRQLKAVADQYGHDEKKPRVLYVATPESMMITGSDTIMGDMVALAGGENIGAQIGKEFPVVGKEAVVNLAPDVLLLGAPDEPDQMKNDPRLEKWQDLPIPAARTHRIYLVTGGNSQMASVEIGKNVETLAELIHRQPAGAPSGSQP